MPLTRTELWATREFALFLHDHESDKFAWGTADCCLFPADAIRSFTGVDLAEDFRGKYDSEATAFALIQSVTAGTTVADAAAYAAAKYSLKEWPSPLLAKRGDLVVLKNGEQLIGGIVHLNGRHIVTMSQDGIRRFPLSSATRAWSV